MPLNSFDYAEAFHSALSAVRASGSQADIGQIAKDIRRKLGSPADEPWNTWLNIAMAADRTWRQSTELNADPSTVHAARDYPVDPTILPGQDRFAWRVAVTFVQPDGTPKDTLVIIRDAGPLSGEAVERLAILAVQMGIQESDTNPGRLKINRSADMTATVVSAGQQRR